VTREKSYNFGHTALICLHCMYPKSNELLLTVDIIIFLLLGLLLLWYLWMFLLTK